MFGRSETERRLDGGWIPPQRIIPSTGLYKHNEFWQVWYKGVMFAEDSNVDYCFEKLKKLISLDDMGTEGETK